MKLFNFKKNNKTWQELKSEQEEAERIKNELNKLKELSEEIEVCPQKIEVKKDGLSEEELIKELKKYPRKKRARLKELYELYQNNKVLQIGNNIDNKEYLSKN